MAEARPSAVIASCCARAKAVPATVISPALTPNRMDRETTSITLGPGMTISNAVAATKAENSVQFMAGSSLSGSLRFD